MALRFPSHHTAQPASPLSPPGPQVCCALFNAAVVHGGLACALDRSEAPFLQRARDHAQRAAAILDHVRRRLRHEGVVPGLPPPPPPRPAGPSLEWWVGGEGGGTTRLTKGSPPGYSLLWLPRERGEG